MEPFVGTGVDPGFNASTMHQKTLTTGPFGNTCEADEVSPKVEAGGLQDSSVYNLAGTQICDYTLNRALSQYNALIYDSYSHHILTLITYQHSSYQD
jgi:hypothetical protein